MSTPVLLGSCIRKIVLEVGKTKTMEISGFARAQCQPRSSLPLDNHHLAKQHQALRLKIKSAVPCQGGLSAQ